MERIICQKNELKQYLLQLLTSSFEINIKLIDDDLYNFYIGKYISEIVDDCWIFIEFPYVDRVYRDSYYAYYSSKWEKNNRDSIRLSFFNSEIRNEDFQDNARVEELRDSYLGFVIIRPTMPKFLGRSVLKPSGVKSNHFLCVTTNIDATVNSIKFVINGFPHSSQDTETITCAETTLWAVMEYFGTKYPDYKPTLPSKIIETLRRVSAERQIPSEGLNVQQMAFALKEFGFGTKIYSKDQYGLDFKRLFSTYVESGIPIIAALENRRMGGDIGHAVVAIGRERVNSSHIDNLQETTESNAIIASIITAGAIRLFDFDDSERDFVFIDDNCPIYQLAKLDSPTVHYPDTRFHSCEITHFMVPLYHRMYLEAFKAKNFFKLTLFSFFQIPAGTEILFRFFLTSSRSFKDSIALNTTFDQRVKDIILETSFPKFIWIGEISDKIQMKSAMASGLFIIDATQGNLQSSRALILASFLGDLLYYDENVKNLIRIKLTLQTFSIFTNNLKGF